MRPQLPEGCVAKVTHLRRFPGGGYYSRAERPYQRPLPKGGITIALVFDGDVAWSASAECSENDNYCKATGRNIAIGRALKYRERESA